MTRLSRKPVFLDQRAIGFASTTAEAIAALKRFAQRQYPDAAIRFLVDELGGEGVAQWRPEEHLSEGRDGFFFAVRLLPGDHG